jgi:hypothetical protein
LLLRIRSLSLWIVAFTPLLVIPQSFALISPEGDNRETIQGTIFGEAGVPVTGAHVGGRIKRGRDASAIRWQGVCMPSYGICSHETMTMLQSSVSSRLQKSVNIVYSPAKHELCVVIDGRSIMLHDADTEKLTLRQIIDLVVAEYYGEIC